MVMMACQWSGVPISTASMSSRASTSRKSLYALQSWLRYLSLTLARACSRCWGTGSQTATICTSGKFRKPPMSPVPWPPQPMVAMTMRSLGAGRFSWASPAAGTSRGAARTPVVFRKSRRVLIASFLPGGNRDCQAARGLSRPFKHACWQYASKSDPCSLVFLPGKLLPLAVQGRVADNGRIPAPAAPLF